MKTLNNIIDENKKIFIYNTKKKKNMKNKLSQEFYIGYLYCEMVLI